MLNEKLEFISDTFTNYYGDGKYFVLFLIAILFLFAKEKNRKKVYFLVYFPICFLALFWCPFFTAIFTQIISESVYYRFLWGIPIGIIIAYSSVQFLFCIDKKTLRDISLLFMITKKKIKTIY